MFAHVSWFTDFLTSVDKQSSGRVQNIMLVTWLNNHSNQVNPTKSDVKF